MRSSSKYAIAMAGLLLASCATPVTNQEAPDADTAVLRLLAQSPGHTVFSRQKTVKFGETQQQDAIRLSGYIVPDERRTNRVAVRVGGRIEKLYVRYPYQYVRKGEKLLDLYSPELTTAISEYLLLLKQDYSSTLTTQARGRLRLLGLSDAQISVFEKDGNAPSVISLYAPYEGYVVPNDGLGTSMKFMPENPGSDGMSGMNTPAGNKDAVNASAVFREGAYVTAGQTLYSINDAKEVIAMLSISPGFQSFIKPGMAVTVTSELVPGRKITGTVNLVEPVLELGQRFLFARIVLTNASGELKYNSLVTAQLEDAVAGINALPSSCVLDLGKRKMVWIKTKEVNAVSVFTPRIVVTGNESGGYTEIISGLAAGDEVALEAGLLVDREGIIYTELK